MRRRLETLHFHLATFWRKRRNENRAVKMNASALTNATSTLWTTPLTSTINAYTSNSTGEVFSNKTNGTTSVWETQDTLNPFLFGLILQSSIFLVVFGNALVLAALLCYRNWTSADVLIFSLSLADVLDSIVALQLITTVKYFMGKHMAKSLCNAFIGLVYTFRVASATTVTGIAIERAILLTQPFRHHTLVTPSRIKKFVLGIWLLSVFSAILPFIGVGHSGFRDGQCFSQIYDLGKAYAIYIEVFGAIQLLAVLASYFAIKLSGKMFIRRQTIMSGHDGNDLRGNRERTQVPGNTSGVRNVRKLTVMMGIVVLFYYISWLPFLLNNMFCLIVDQEPAKKVVVFTSVISLLHAVVNPPLYGWMSQRYRRGYLFLFKMALSVCGGTRPNRRSLSVSRRYCNESNLKRRATSTDMTVYNSRLSLPVVDFTSVADRKESKPDNKEIPHTPEGKTDEDIENNNEPLEAHAHATMETAVEVDEIAGTDDKSLVYADVIQLLEAILERLEE